MKKQKKFWNWKNQTEADEGQERVLELYGTIAETSWFDDDVTPQMFHDELFAGTGPVTVWLNSPGGDCIAASQIYTMLMDYQGDVTVKIDGIAASAASVIAMAGTTVLMAPTALMMIHNPMTMAYGNHEDMEKAIEMLDEVKESIINAYELKTSMSRAKLSHLMDSETWMNANKAMELGLDAMLLAVLHAQIGCRTAVGGRTVLGEAKKTGLGFQIGPVERDCSQIEELRIQLLKLGVLFLGFQLVHHKEVAAETEVVTGLLQMYLNIGYRIALCIYKADLAPTLAVGFNAALNAVFHKIALIDEIAQDSFSVHRFFSSVHFLHCSIRAPGGVSPCSGSQEYCFSSSQGKSEHSPQWRQPLF